MFCCLMKPANFDIVVLLILLHVCCYYSQVLHMQFLHLHAILLLSSLFLIFIVYRPEVVYMCEVWHLSENEMDIL